MKSIKDLSQGLIFIELIQKLVTKQNFAKEFDESERWIHSDIGICYEFINLYLVGKYYLNEYKYYLNLIFLKIFVCRFKMRFFYDKNLFGFGKLIQSI